MKNILALTVCLLALSGSAFAADDANTNTDTRSDYAAKRKGWHDGMYFLLGVGTMGVSQDRNVTTGGTLGSNYLTAYGFTIGGNFLDHWAIELQTRIGYENPAGVSTDEYAGYGNVDVRYSFFLPFLTSFKTIRFIPYVKGGGGAFLAVIPAQSTRDPNDRVFAWAPEANFGAGLEILIAKYLYVGADFTEDIVFMKEKKNSDGNVVMNGGTNLESSLMGYVGVHF